MNVAREVAIAGSQQQKGGSMFKWLPVRELKAASFAALLVVAGRTLALPASSSVLQASGSACYVWGQVRSPGAYGFVANPDILELLSAGGGPTDLRRVVLIRAVTQKPTSVDLQTMLASGQIVRPTPGDVVVVPSSPWYHVRDWLSVATVASTLATPALTIVNRVGA
jgi:protein involved in polysaccharide export with SLBB domain